MSASIPGAAFRPPTGVRAARAEARRELGLQGGGALGACQAGVYERLSEARLETDWLAGISTGAINAALIAGDAPQLRVQRLREFWDPRRRAGPRMGLAAELRWSAGYAILDRAIGRRVRARHALGAHWRMGREDMDRTLRSVAWRGRVAPRGGVRIMDSAQEPPAPRS